MTPGNRQQSCSGANSYETEVSADERELFFELFLSSHGKSSLFYCEVLIMIHIKELTKVYPTPAGNITALECVNLHIEKGEIFGIIGLSGAGKSTLLRCINMLEKPTSGTIYIDGVDMTKLSSRQLRESRKKVGMIFQHFNLLSSRTVWGNVAFPLEIAETKKSSIDEKVEGLLSMVGLLDRANSYPSQLSGGQKQRVGIARALANEATSALDPKTTLSILDLLRDIHRQMDLTIALITHQIEVVKQICHTVAVMDNSKVVEQGSLLSMLSRPKTATAKSFLSSITLTQLPDGLRDRIRHLNASKLEGNIVKIDFFGGITAEPVISSLVKKFDVDANILYGNIDHIEDTPYGSLVIELRGKNGGAADAINYLTDLGLEVEVIENA